MNTSYIKTLIEKILCFEYSFRNETILSRIFTLIFFLPINILVFLLAMSSLVVLSLLLVVGYLVNWIFFGDINGRTI